MKLKLLVFLCIIIFTGCAQPQYSPSEIRTSNISITNIKGKLEIDNISYNPPKGISPQEISLYGNLRSTFQEVGVSTHVKIAEFAKIEINRIKDELLLASNNKSKCKLNGTIKYLGKSSANADIKTIIIYSVTKDNKAIFKKNITYFWSRSFFDLKTSLFQSLANSIHGNFANLTYNSDFRKIIKENCQ